MKPYLMFLSSLSQLKAFRKHANHPADSSKIDTDAPRRLQKAVVFTAQAALNVLLSSTYIQQEMFQAAYAYLRKYATKLKDKSLRD